MDDLQHQAEAYIRCLRESWAQLRLTEDCRKAPERAWLVIEAVTSLPDWPSIEGHLAAGPLEDLLSHHGEEFIGRVEALAAENAEFRSCLSHCYQLGMSDSVHARVRAASSTGWVGVPPLPNVRSHPVLGLYFRQWGLRPHYSRDGEFSGARVTRAPSEQSFSEVGLLPDDLIVAINDSPLREWFELWEHVRDRPDPRLLSWQVVRATTKTIHVPRRGVA